MATEQWTDRTELLVGTEKLQLLKDANVLIVGLGGVGAYAAEMICRAGVGSMTIADCDTINTTNINRQLIALNSLLGLSKATVMASRLKDINPNIQLTVVDEYIKDTLTDTLLDSAKFDFVVDAIDTLSPKVALINGCLSREYPMVSSMGAGAKTDPTRVEIKDISKTHHCPLAHMLRKRLHKIGIQNGFWAVFSAEIPRNGAMMEVENEQNKKSTVGTISYMPAVFGCAAASVVIRGLMGEMQ
ncbi:MAG: tRNA threonylcarbamoyladenosine dehydratase [Mucinivorans sp.]